MTTFATANARKAIKPYWWVRIEGLQYRYSTLRAGVDSLHDAMADMKAYLAGPPSIGGQMADPLNGKCSIPSHAFTLFDKNDEITALVSVSDTPWYKTYLTAPVTAAETTFHCEDNSSFPNSGTLYLDRETITYTGKLNANDTDTSTAGLTGQTATGGSADTLEDTARTEDDANSLSEGHDSIHYWAGSIVTVTAGTNNGEVRTVRDSYWDEDNSTGVLIFDSPMPAACDATTVYTVTYNPMRIKAPTLSGSDDYWKGGIVEVTAGTNVGEQRWVRHWDLSETLLELVTPMPVPCDGTTVFKIYMWSFTGCTRGKWESEAVEHLLLDENGAVIRRPLSDKVPFIKTRKVWLYENRIGCADTEAIVSVGVIKDHALSNNHTSYTFQCSGLLELMTGKLLADQAVGHIARKHLWGGHFEKRDGILWESTASGGDYVAAQSSAWHFGFKMADGRVTGFTTDRVIFTSEDDFPTAGGHIKIDDELLRYSAIHYVSDADATELYHYMKLGATTRFWDEADVPVEERDLPDVAGYGNRGLFSELVMVRPDWRKGQGPMEGANPIGGSMPRPPGEINAFIQEHEIGAEIKQALACYDGAGSDFQRYDRIDYSNLAGGTFAVGDTITGATSAQTAVIMDDDTTNDVLTIAFVSSQSGAFTVGESISVGGVSADVDAYVKEVRPRNNAIDVFLQLLLSTGTVGANGKYDTLPSGFGIGLDSSLVDVDAIETLRDKYFAGTQVNFCIHEPTGAQEFFEKNLFMPLQVFPFESTEGKISLSYLLTYQEAVAANASSALESLGEDELVATPLPSWNSGKPPVGKLIVRYNKHPVKDDYLGPPVDVIFGHVREWYKDLGRNVKLDMPTLYHPDQDIRRVRHRDHRIPALLRRMLGVVWDRHAQYPCPVIGAQASYDNVLKNVGDAIKFTNSNLPNMRTSLRGMTDEFFQVIGRTPDPASGLMQFVLWQIGVHDNKYARRAPSAKALSYTFPALPGISKVAVYPSVFSPPGTGDLESFSVGEEVMFLAADYDKLSAPIETYTIQNISGDNVYFTGAITTPPTDGCWMEYADYDSCTSAQQTSRTFMADPDHVIGTGDDSAFKYQ